MTIKVHRLTSDFSFKKPIALVLGSFDGVHRGHQQLLSKLRMASELYHCAPAVMSFYPHPRVIVTHQQPAMLSTMHDRAYWLEHYGVAHWLLQAFTPSFRHLSPQDFVRNYLLKHLSIRYLLVGDDFRFGYRGAGDFRLLAEMQAEGGYILDSVDTVMTSDGERISSSKIRHLLAMHDITQAKQLLGHALTFTSVVRHGDARGRKLNAPTANLHVPAAWCLPNGVYVVKLSVCNMPRIWHWGIANLGVAPTFGGSKRKFEVHLLGESMTLYHQQVQVSVEQFIRGEKCFADINDLKVQISQDIEVARAYIAAQANKGSD